MTVVADSTVSRVTLVPSNNYNEFNIFGFDEYSKLIKLYYSKLVKLLEYILLNKYCKSDDNKSNNIIHFGFINNETKLYFVWVGLGLGLINFVFYLG